MHVWRWWSSAAVLSLCLLARPSAAQVRGPVAPVATPTTATAPAEPPLVTTLATRPPAPTWAPVPASKTAIDAFVHGEAEALKVADPMNAAAIKDSILAGVVPLPPKTKGPVPVEYQSMYGDAIARELGSLAVDPKLPGHAQLNAIIAIASIKSISCDVALRNALPSSNVAVRYWAAKGLNDILTDLKDVPKAFKAACDDLKKALATEKSPLVQTAILKALGTAGADGAGHTAILDFLTREATALQAGAPTPAENQAIATGLSSLKDIISGGVAVTPPDDANAAQVIVNVMSFSGQRLWLADPTGASQTVAQKAPVAAIARAGATAINAIARGPKVVEPRVNDRSTPAEILGGIKTITGGDVDAGTIATVYKTVTPPPTLK